MAIYKPTDCNPFNGTFDITADLPIIFECKVDTSNTTVTGYSIEIYDSNNNLIFPTGENGPIESNVTYLSDLRTYFNNNFAYLGAKSRNVNSGLNGTYLEIPFYVKEEDRGDASSTVSRNQMSENSDPNLTEGQTYTWKITLYQEIKNGSSRTFPPTDAKFYDMTVANGTVIGSNEKRIQTALIDSDDDVVDNLVLIDKFIQPILIENLKKSTNPDTNYNPATPKEWIGTIPTTFSTIRSLITGYDSSYGYIYPSTAAGNAFAEGQIVPENANGFQIFKNGNNPANLGATDMVSFIYDEDHFKGTKTWKTTPATPELSYWEQVYTVYSEPNGVYYPFEGETYGTYPLSGEERVVFNRIQESKVMLNGSYYGSPYNGIFKPYFSYKQILSGGSIEGNVYKIAPGTYTFKEGISLKDFSSQTFTFISNGENFYGMSSSNNTLYYNTAAGNTDVYNSLNDEWKQPAYRTIVIENDDSQNISADFLLWFLQNIVKYEVTVIWNRTTDASNWGTLSNKIIYNQQDGKNYEINTATQIGEINKTPFKFVKEKPVKIFNTAVLQLGKTPEKINRIDSNSCIFLMDSVISSLSSVTLNDVDVTKDCIFEIGQNNIIYTSSSVLPEKLDFKVTYVPYVYQDYAGIIFYNQAPTANGDTGYLYIRPAININKNMIFKELTTTSDSTWFNIDKFNKDYNFITYKYNDKMKFSPKVDKTRYQIKTFYKESDYNPFSIYENPVINSYLIVNGIKQNESLAVGGAVNELKARNFSVVAEYIQDSYISWKSYQWILYDARKRTVLEKTDEKYDGEITGTFYGLEQGISYILSLILQTNTGKIIEIDYVLQTSFKENEYKPNIVEAKFDCDTLAMKATVNLETTIIAPEADQYLNDGADGTAYYYNKSANFYTKDGSGIASIITVNNNGILKIEGNNSLDFQRSFAEYDISNSTQSADIQIDSDQIVVEGSFYFSENYQGDIFSLTNDDSEASIRINIPEALKNVGESGLVKLSDDIDKIVVHRGSNTSYLNIYIKENSEWQKVSEWQNASDFHNTSVWKEDGKEWEPGDRINVANFKYAETTHRIDKSIIPYPYEEGEEIEAEDGTKIFWNQIIDTGDAHSTKTIGGIEFVNNGDGTITANGTATGKNATYSLISGGGQSGHIYMSFGCPDGGGFETYRIENTIQKDEEYTHGFSDAGNGYISTALEEGEYFISDIRIYQGASVQNLIFKPQIFDLTLMFGSGNEPTTVDEFWNYFSNRFYLKNTYLNINAPYNSYDGIKPLKNPMNPGKKSVKFSVQNQTNNNTSEDYIVDGYSFQINEPDRLIWLDYVPVTSQKAVVVNADNVGGVTTQSMTVMEDEPLRWDDNSAWKDGIYVESGFPKTLIGQISINGVVVRTDCLDATEPITYSNSGLTKQKQVDKKISERNTIANYNFAFRIFINTNTFSVDMSNSYCYVTKRS